MDAETTPNLSPLIAIEITTHGDGYRARTPLVRGLVAIAPTRAEVIAAMISALTERFTWSPVPAGDLAAVEVVAVTVPLPAPPIMVPQRPPGMLEDRPLDHEASAAAVVTTDSYLQALRTTPAEEIATAALYQLERRFTGILQLLALRSIPDMDGEAIITAVQTQAYQGRIELFDYLRDTLIPQLQRYPPTDPAANQG